MSVVQRDNELTIKLTHQDGDKDLEVQATEKVMDLLQAVCDRLGITLSLMDVSDEKNCDRTDTDYTSTGTID